MIEKVYSGKEPENEGNVRIPKNIRQIGKSNSNKKIYVEDYVINQLKKVPDKENDIAYGVLLGEIRASGGNSYIFIKGMIYVDEIIENSIIFNDEIWSAIYRDKKHFFEKPDIVGWFLSVPYRVSEDMNGIRKIHLDNFAGNNKVCFLSDRTENEEGFYLYEQTSLCKQKGYYIYYEKNEKMKKYIKSRDNSQKNPADSVQVKMEEKQKKGSKKEGIPAADNIKEKNRTNGEDNRRQGRLAYGVNGILIIALLLSTVVMLNNYGELKNIKKELANYSMTREAKAVNEIIDAYSGNEVFTKNEPVTEKITNGEKGTKKEIITETKKEVITEEITEALTERAAKKKAEAETEYENAKASSFSGTYHTVEKGQTLYDISIKYYGTSSMVEKIKEINKIDDDYKIIEGEKILLP